MQEVQGFNEIVTGDMMRILTAAVYARFGRVPKLLLLIISSDAANVTHWSDRQVHPWYLAIGNDSANVRNSVIGKQPIAYLEKIPGTLSCFISLALFHTGITTKKNKRPFLNTYIWQQAARILFSSLIATQHSGMIYSCLLLSYFLLGCLLQTSTNGNTGVLTPFLPLLYSHLGDTPEVLRAACLFSGNTEQLQKGCWTCEIPGHMLHSPQTWPTRDWCGLFEKVRSWQNTLNTDPSKSSIILKECKKESSFPLLVCAAPFISY